MSVTQARLVDGRFQIIQPDGTSHPAAGRTNWERIRAVGEVEIEAAAHSDPDNVPMSDEEWLVAVSTPTKQYVHIGLDQQGVAWFKRDGRGYQTRINAVLRRYVEARAKAG